MPRPALIATVAVAALVAVRASRQRHRELIQALGEIRPQVTIRDITAHVNPDKQGPFIGISDRPLDLSGRRFSSVIQSGRTLDPKLRISGYPNTKES